MVWVTAAIMVVGVLGILVPVLPGLFLVWGAVVLWALTDRTSAAWMILALCTAWYAAGLVGQYLVPGQRMRAAGVQTRTLLVAAVLGIIGFFVVPVLGAAIGFVGGIFLIEFGRTRVGSTAWAATTVALRAVLLSMGIELGVALAIATTWGLGVFLSR